MGDWLLQVMNIDPALWVKQIVCWNTELGFSHWRFSFQEKFLHAFWLSCSIMLFCYSPGGILKNFGLISAENEGDLQICQHQNLSASECVMPGSKLWMIWRGERICWGNLNAPYTYTSLVIIILLNRVERDELWRMWPACWSHLIGKMSVQEVSWQVLRRSPE
jgi:hypothetical protein